MTDVGRVLSALVDLFSVVLVYAIGSRLFKKPVGLLAAAFTAFTVLNIQQSHFFTMDTFSSFFTLLAIYFAVRVSLVTSDPLAAQNSRPDDPERPAPDEEPDRPPQSVSSRLVAFIKHPFFALSIAFGVCSGHGGRIQAEFRSGGFRAAGGLWGDPSGANPPRNARAG